MAKNQVSTSDEDFEFMGDTTREDPVIAEVNLFDKIQIKTILFFFQRRRVRENEITKKLGEYLLKGYCMLGDTCEDCNVR